MKIERTIFINNNMLIVIEQEISCKLFYIFIKIQTRYISTNPIIKFYAYLIFRLVEILHLYPYGSNFISIKALLCC